VRVRTCLQENLDERSASTDGGQKKGSCARTIRHAGMCARLYERASHFDVVPPCGPVKRCCAVRLGESDVDFLRNESVDCFDIPLHCRVGYRAGGCQGKRVRRNHQRKKEKCCRAHRPPPSVRARMDKYFGKTALTRPFLCASSYRARASRVA